MSSNKFFYLNGIQDNHLVGQSVMKPVDDVAFHKIKSMREGNNDESENFEKEILYEGALNNFLTFTEETVDVKTLEENLGGHWRWIIQ